MTKMRGLGGCVAVFALLLAGRGWGANVYVVPTNAAAAEPYDTWAKAATRIQAAVDYASGHIETCNTVIVSNGTYNITNQIVVASGITVRSVEGGLGGAAKTIVRRSAGDSRVLSITHKDAVVEGLTIREGNADNATSTPPQGNGNGVFMTGGTVRDCIIADNGRRDRVTGAGVYMTGGAVVNCVIRGNRTAAASGGGGGVYMTGGMVQSCRIEDNAAPCSDGGGVWSSGGTIRNCLIRNNSAAGNGAGVYNGAIESCTVVGNYASGAHSLGGGTYGGTAVDSIVCLNRVVNTNPDVRNYYGGAFAYSCTVPAAGGFNVSDVAFADAAKGDFRLKPCAAVDSGNALPWMEGALDFGGKPRVQGGTVDMGAYEYVPGPLESGLAADVTSFIVPSQVVFTAFACGSKRAGLTYRWDFGNGNEKSGAGLGIVTNTYTMPGLYTVKLTVSNAGNEVAVATKADYITVWAANAFVWSNSPSPSAPYHAWANAARTIADAVGAVPDGVTVWVTNGTYDVLGEITVSKGITVRSVQGELSGASNTVVRRSTTAEASRIFKVTHGGAVLQGLTITGGRGRGGLDGNGVNMTGGLVRDCIIADNGHGDNYRGGGVYMTGGTVSNCIVRGNRSNNNWAGGIYANGGSILACQIFDNSAGDSAGGVMLDGAVTLRNSLIVRNGAGGLGGGVWVKDGAIENCTIAGNNAAGEAGGGGIYREGGRAGAIRNSIVYGNTSGHALYKNINAAADAELSYCCTTNPVVAGNGCITDNPLFVDPAGGNYRLQYAPEKSPCIDAGLNAEWVAEGRDVDGKPRLFQNVVDMGAYEAWPAVPMLRPAGVSKMADKTATVRCNVVWPGPVEAALFVCHGPDDGGTNRQAWANEIRVPGPVVAGFREIGLSHSASNRTWCYRWFATNVNGAVWADSTGGLTLGAIEVKATKRESTEEKAASFVITRPATAINGPLDVYFSLGGTGVNGTDYDALESPAIIPAGATEVRLPVVPSFREDDKRPKGVELTIAPGGYQIGLNGKASIVTKVQ